jgi:hypothetical protein
MVRTSARMHVPAGYVYQKKGAARTAALAIKTDRQMCMWTTSNHPYVHT